MSCHRIKSSVHPFVYFERGLSAFSFIQSFANFFLLSCVSILVQILKLTFCKKQRERDFIDFIMFCLFFRVTLFAKGQLGNKKKGTKSSCKRMKRGVEECIFFRVIKIGIITVQVICLRIEICGGTSVVFCHRSEKGCQWAY